MSTTKISNLFVPELAVTYKDLVSLDKNAFFMSGVAVSDPTVTPLMDATQGGQIISMPYFRPIDDIEANIGTDDNTQKSSPRNITTGYETAVKTYQNTSFSVMDLARMAAGANPMTAINNGINKYWTNQAEARLIAAATGIVNESIANHEGDLVHDVTKEGDGLLGASGMNDAAGDLGESLVDIKAICVHPNVFTQLRNKNLITTMQESATRTLFNVYGDYLLFVDKNMPVEGNAETGFTYYSYMFGAGAFIFNYGNPGVEYEVDRDPASGNGAGEELLYSRRCDLILPRGYQTNPTREDGTKVIKGLSKIDLAKASTWTRSWSKEEDSLYRERIKFVAIKSKG